jgi:alpha-L-fucosidase
MTTRKFGPALILAAGLAAALAGCSETRPVRMTKDALRDKIRGGWAGQVIGCTFGGPTEFRFKGTFIQDYQPLPWDPGAVARAMRDEPGLFDDVYVDLTFVEVLRSEGLDAPASAFARAFAEAPYPLWHANRAARYNILSGLEPPASGAWPNNPHADDVDFQIEADFAGLMSPGMVGAAAEICDRVGHIMNSGDGWYGGVYVAAMYALAFVSDSPEVIAREALKVIPEGTAFHAAMSDVLRWHAENPDDWHGAVGPERSAVLGLRPPRRASSGRAGDPQCVRDGRPRSRSRRRLPARLSARAFKGREASPGLDFMAPLDYLDGSPEAFRGPHRTRGESRHSPDRDHTGDREARMNWWTEARFGMFIHWGLYALAARHEWVKSREKMSDEAYQRYFDRFLPDLYDPKDWARTAREAGMGYFVVTAKHHDGFCLWDSARTEYKASRTPAGRDLLRPLVEAMRAEGLRVGFYYSLLDWHHPDYPIDLHHPMRDDRESAAGDRDMGKYADYLGGQLRELLTDFGRIDVLFLDFSFPGPAGKGRADWRSEELIKMIRELQPEILVNDRLDLLDVPGGWDFRTPEQFLPREWVRAGGRLVPWETCQTFSGSWGYHRDEATWKSVRQILVMLIETVSKGGNFLLNVGPTGRGTFDSRALDRLRGVGGWMAVNGRSIHGCTQAPEGWGAPANCLLTFSPAARRLYVHVLEWPAGVLELDGYAGRVDYAQLLHDASEIPFAAKDGRAGFMAGGREEGRPDTLLLRLPILKPEPEVPVIELFLSGRP